MTTPLWPQKPGGRKIPPIWLLFWLFPLMGGYLTAQPSIGLSPASINLTTSTCFDVFTRTVTISNSGSSTLNWSVDPATAFFEDDFNPDPNRFPPSNSRIDSSMWTSISGGTADSACGSPGFDPYVLYFNGGSVREAISKDINTLSGGSLSWSIKIATGTAPCEAAEAGEEVYVEYSINGGNNWVRLDTLDVTAYPNFTTVNVPLPEGARASATRFRWLQTAFSGTGEDNWALARVAYYNSTSTISQISPSSGSIPAGGNTQVTINIDAGLSIEKRAFIESGKVVFTSNDPNNPFDEVDFEITKFGDGGLYLSTNSLDFGSVPTGASDTLLLLFSDTTCWPLDINNMAISNPVFKYDSSAFIGSPGVFGLIPDELFRLPIIFTPTSAATFNGNLTFQTTDPSNPNVTVALTGSGGTAPGISLNPTSLTATLNTCSASSTQSFTITNTGGGQLNWSSALMQNNKDNFENGTNSNLWSYIEGGEASGECGSNQGLKALYFNGGNQRLAVTRAFNETIEGERISFYLKIGQGPAPCADASAGEDVRLEYSIDGGLSWTLIAVYAENAYPNFTQINQSLPQASLISGVRFRWIQPNHDGAGTDNWSIDDVAIGSAAFGVQSISPASGTIAGGGNTLVTVEFSSDGLIDGDLDANLHLTTNAPGNTNVTIPYEITVNGNPAINDPAGLLDLNKVVQNDLEFDFGIVSSGRSLSDTLVLINNGCAPLTYSNSNVGGGSDFSCQPSSGSIPAYGSQVFVFTFNPASSGNYSVNRRFITNQGNFEIPMLGDACAGAPGVSPAGPLSICSQGDSLTLSSSSSMNIVWNTGALGMDVLVREAGEYFVIYTDPLGCKDTSNVVTINELPDPEINVQGNFTTICEGSSITLSGTNASSYLWSTGANTQIISPTLNDTTNFTLTATNSRGCVFTESITINTLPAVSPGQVSNMIPSNGATNLDIPLTFSWAPASNASQYDLYIWPSTGSQPPNPTAGNIRGISYLFTSSLGFGQGYNWRIVAKNSCFETPGPVQSFDLRPLPDLQVSNIQVPSQAFSGQSMSISWEVQNQGQGSTQGQSWFDAVFLSADNSFEPGIDTYLGAVSNFSSLPNGQSYSQNGNFTLPQGISGDSYVFVVTDYFTDVVESDDNNNDNGSTDSVAIQLTPPPDLQVSSVIAPQSSFSGQAVQIIYTVENLGPGRTLSGIWQDRLFIGINQNLNLNTAILLRTSLHSGNLLANESYSDTLMVNLPQGINGKYYFHLLTDLANNEFEYVFENNNSGRSDSIDIILSPPPNLEISQVIAPASASNNELINLSWTVSNTGATASNGPWIDKVFISSRADSNLRNAQLIGEFPNLQNLSSTGTNSSYIQTQQVQIPNFINGTYYLYVLTDADDQIYEFSFEGDNLGRSLNAVMVNSPDVRANVTAVPGSGTAGQNIVLQWEIDNAGTGKATGRPFTDNIYLSTSSTFNAASAIRVGSYVNAGNITNGGSQRNQQLFTLPNGVVGNYFIHVWTDEADSLFENGLDANNIDVSSNAINISSGSYPDLGIANIQYTDTVRAGDTLILSYSVTNSGSNSTGAAGWLEEIYFQLDPVWNPSQAQLISEIIHSRPIVNGQSETVTTPVSIPMLSQVVPGLDSFATGYLFILVDGDSTVYESNENNNRVRSLGFYAFCPPPVDLELISASLAGSNFNSGDPARISYISQNIGSTSRYWNYPLWYDGIYLSTDQVWDCFQDIFVTDTVIPGPIDNGDVYNGVLDFNLPNGIAGNYYVFMVTDHTDLNQDGDTSNNAFLVRNGGGQPQLISISLTPSPDLEVSQVQVPNLITTGQPFTIQWTVENNGFGPTTAGSWVDRVYLSNDLNLDAGDRPLGNFIRNNDLNQGQFYTASAQISLPISSTGNLVLLIQTDDNQAQYEHQGEANNISYALILAVKAPPADLVVENILAPNMAMAGDSISISWSLKNQGVNPARGQLTEGVFLSLDQQWDVGDILLERKNSNITLLPNSSTIQSLKANLTGVSLDEYYVIVRTDLLDNISESNNLNNSSNSFNRVEITVPQLLLQTLTPANLDNNRRKYYRIEIPAVLQSESLFIRLRGDSLNASNQLYVRHGEVPSEVVYDEASFTPFEANQEIVIPSLFSGTYYLMIKGESTGSLPQSVDLFAKVLPFEIRQIDAIKGGNTGSVTIQLDGSKFEPNMQVVLQNNGNEIYASQLYYISPIKAFATFDLAGQARQFYDVVAINRQRDTARLANSFEIVEGDPVGLSGIPAGTFSCTIENAGGGSGIGTSIINPTTTRINRIVPITIHFANTGNIDLPTPTRLLVSLRGAPIALSVADLDKGESSLLIEFDDSSGPPGILRPGGSGSVTVYAKATAQLEFRLFN